MLRATMEKSRVIRRTLAFAGVACAAGLVLFHVGLLWAQLATGRLSEPAVALRWLGAVLVLGVMLHHRRAGASLLRSRKGLVLCVVVALLHGNAAAPPEGDAGAAWGVTEALLALPASTVPLVLSLGLVFAALAVGRGLVPAPARAVAPVPRASVARLTAAPLLCLSPRPPPA